MPRYEERGRFDSPIAKEGDRAFIGMNSREQPALLKPGVFAYGKNVRLDKVQADVRKGVKRLSSEFDLTDVPLILPFNLAADVLAEENSILPVLSNARRISNVINFPCTTEHGFSTGDQINIRGFGQSSFNGDHIITVIDTTTFSYPSVGIDENGIGQGYANNGPIIRNSYSDGVFGSEVYSDANDDNKEYIAIATANKLILWNEDGSTTDIAYSTGSVALADNASLVQANNQLVLHRGKNKTALVWSGDVNETANLVPSGTFTYPTSNLAYRLTRTDNICTCSASDTVTSVTFTNPSADVANCAHTSHGRLVGDYVVVSGNSDAAYNGEFEITSVPDANNFRYAITGTGLSSDTGDYYGGTSHNMVDGQLATMNATTSDADKTNAIISVTNKVRFTYSAAGANISSPEAVTVNSKIPLSGGFVHMPNVEWSLYFQGRLWVPDGSDGILGSDIFDFNTYDPIFNQLKFNKGSKDFIMGAHPYQEDSLIVFFRKSLHLLTGVRGSLADVQSFEITRRLGCVSRKTIVTAGNKILFLSDNGIQSIDIGVNLKLVEDQAPLSEDIDDIIQNINFTAAVSKATAIYYNNRYYIAIPYGTATYNNLILVYNFLNQAWESVDEYPGDFQLMNFHLLCYEGRDRLFAVTDNGGIYLMEEEEWDETGTIGQSISDQVDIDSYILTRQYTANSMDDKQFFRGQIHFESGSRNTNLSVEAITQNPDETTTVATYTDTANEDYTKRFSLRPSRGYGLQLKVKSTAGRLTFRNVKIESSVFGRQQEQIA